MSNRPTWIFSLLIIVVAILLWRWASMNDLLPWLIVTARKINGTTHSCARGCSTEGLRERPVQDGWPQQ